MVAIKCAICSSNKLKFILKAKDPDGISSKYYSLYKCSNCAVASVNPIPSNKELEKFYNESYYAYNYYGLLNRCFLKLRANKVQKNKRNGSILDIGCGEGSFLEEMEKRGFECYGLETSKAGITASRKKGIVVYEDIQKIKRKFDVITLWHVFEHITNPLFYLKTIRKLLNKNGQLIIAVPNFDSWQSKIGRNVWFYLVLPRHVFQYTHETIKYLLSKGRFKVIKVQHFSLEYNPFGFMQTFLNLITRDINNLYKIIRRGSYKFNSSTMALLLLPILIPISIIFSIYESVIKKGGTIIVYSRRF